MIKTITILGYELIQLYNESRKIPTKEDVKRYCGAIWQREFENSKESDAYILGIQDRDNYEDYIVKIENQSAKDQIICTCCGKSDVYCDASVNPNTGTIINLEDDAFCDGHCQDCGWEILSNKTELLRKIDQCYNENSNADTTIYALYRVAYTFQNRDVINESFDTIIKLNTNVVESEDDEICDYCDGIDSFKKLIEPEDKDYVVIDIYKFSNSISS